MPLLRVPWRMRRWRQQRWWWWGLARACSGGCGGRGGLRLEPQVNISFQPGVVDTWGYARPGSLLL